VGEVVSGFFVLEEFLSWRLVALKNIVAKVCMYVCVVGGRAEGGVYVVLCLWVFCVSG